MTISERKNQYKKIFAENGNVNYYERLKLRRAAFPGEFDSNLQYALLEAGRQTQEFMYFVTDTEHARHKETIKEYVSKFNCLENNVGDHFRAIVLAQYAIDKEAIINGCTDTAKQKAQAFIESLLNPDNENHVQNVAIFKSKYKEIPDQIESDFVNELLNKRGYKPEIERPVAYEKTLSVAPVGLNPYQLTAFKSLQSLYALKWQSVGTDGDDLIYQQFVSETPLRDFPDKGLPRIVGFALHHIILA